MQNNTFSGLFVGQNVITLTTVDSTNNYLKDQLANSAPLPEGTVILAEHQFAGRGQHTNKWHSEPQMNLTFSILLKPGFLTISQQFLLNKAISNAINETLVNIIGDTVKIKWPNDIYAGNKKMGGILIENIIQGTIWKHAIIGIGINVNQVEFNPELKHVTSISKILQSNYDLQVLLSEICNSVEAWYLKLKAGKINDIVQTYMSRLYRFNETHFFKANGIVFNGTVVNVSQTGLLEINDGSTTTSYNIKEIEFII